MNKAIFVNETGGPEVLSWQETELPELGKDQALIRQTAIGLNMIDTYFRKGLYPFPVPFIPGVEAAGIVEEIGANVSDITPGQRIVYVAPTTEIGAYCQKRLINHEILVPLPESISDEVAAASFLKGLTAWVLLKRIFPVSTETILVYAAAGGVGSILCQWASHLGARVIGVVGSKEKVDLARRCGCDEVIDYSVENIAEKVMEITKGNKVSVVYDSVGKDTFNTSLDCLAPLGMMVSYGNATGPVPPVDILELMRKGSITLIRPMFYHYVQDRNELLHAAKEWFELIINGVIDIKLNQRYALADAAIAHKDLEARKTTGLTVLIP